VNAPSLIRLLLLATPDTDLIDKFFSLFSFIPSKPVMTIKHRKEDVGREEGEEGERNANCRLCRLNPALHFAECLAIKLGARQTRNKNCPKFLYHRYLIIYAYIFEASTALKEAD